MELLGTFNHSLDAKNRLFIPAKFREELGDEFCIFCRPGASFLTLYPREKWEKLKSALNNYSDTKGIAAKRLIFSMAMQVTPDSNGRIILLPQHLKFAGIEKNTVIVGVGDQAEIWAEDAYARETSQTDVESVQRLLADLGL